jgi:hypothetical protein
MSELSTADLAGGTTPRSREQLNDADFRARDPRMDTGDPAMHDDLSDSPMDRDMPMQDADERAGTVRTVSSSSRLANPAANDGAAQAADAALFPAGEADDFRGRWTEVQTGFVDEPRNAVEQADSLVAEMMQRLAKVFAEERARLEEQWSRGDDISTEDLRQALRRYRSFFNRLLSV